MTRPLPIARSFLAAGLTAVTLAAASASAVAVEVTKVQLGFTDSGSNLCPRVVTMKAWAHTEGPGVVEFVIRNSSGNKTGAFPVAAVKGPAGNWLATLTREIKITTDVDTKYMAEVKGSPRISNWVPLVERCLGKAPKTVSGGKGPPAKHISEVDKDDGPQTQSGGKPTGKPSGQGKPAGGGKPVPQGKPIAQCVEKKVTATRLAALTKKGGIGSAWTAWEIAAKKQFGATYASSHNAKNRKETCTWAGTFTCTVSATPCRS
jgi:hypothetical protein